MLSTFVIYTNEYIYDIFSEMSTNVLISYYSEYIPPTIISQIRISRSPLISEIFVIPSDHGELLLYFLSNFFTLQGISLTVTVLYSVIPDSSVSSLFSAHNKLISCVFDWFRFYKSMGLNFLTHYFNKYPPKNHTYAHHIWNKTTALHPISIFSKNVNKYKITYMLLSRAVNDSVKFPVILFFNNHLLQYNLRYTLKKINI